MVTSKDVEINLQQVIARSHELPQDEYFDLYCDPDTLFFYIYPYNILHYWIPSGACFIGRGPARELRLVIEKFIGQAVRKLIREENIQL